MRIVTDYAEIGRHTSRYVPVIGPKQTAKVIERSGAISFLGYQSSTAIRLYDILIDCGCSIRAVQEEIERGHKIQAVCLTHRHSDHVRPETLQWLAGQGYPIYGNEDTQDAYGDIITVIAPEQMIETEQLRIIPYEGDHTVPVYLYAVKRKQTGKIALITTDSRLTEDVWQSWWRGRIDLLIAEYRYIESWLDILKSLTPDGADKLRTYHHREVTGEPMSDEDFAMLQGHASKEEVMKLWEWCRKSEAVPVIRIASKPTLYCD